MRNIVIHLSTGVEVKHEDVSAIKAGTNWLEFKSTKWGNVKFNRDFVVSYSDFEVEEDNEPAA